MTFAPVRWAFNISSWEPTDGELHAALQLLPEQEQAACTRFHQLADRKRALASRLLQRRLGAQCFGCTSFQDVCIERTANGKPYFPVTPTQTDALRVNFNVSHEVSCVAAV